MRKLPLALGASMFALALTLTGCTASGPSETSTSSTPARTSSASAADEMFVVMMIPHHEQAVEMADIVLTKSDIDPKVTELAQNIKDAQGPEIDRMLGWLQEWGVEYNPNDNSTGGMDHGSMGGMDGMMSDEDMSMLEDADGPTASRIFLEQMILHHEGAVEMAETALKDATDPDVRELAEQVIDDQNAEIATMQDLLTQL